MTDTTELRPRPSLKRALMLLTAALAVPLLALQGWWSLHDYRTARVRAEADALAFADATALGVLQFFTQAEELMTRTALEFGVEGMTGSGCQRHIRTMVNLFPFLSNAVTVTADGTIVCSYRELPGPVTAAEWPWFDSVRENPVFTVGDPVVGDIVDAWILPLVAPLLGEDGEFVGALVGTVELTRMSEYVGAVQLPETHLITVATADRIVIARSHEPEGRVGQPLPPLTGSDRETAPGRWVATGPDLEGIPRTWGQVEISPGWVIYVGVPDEVVYGPARRESLSHVLTTLLVVLLGMVLAGGSYRAIARSLRELADRTWRMGAGQPVPVPPGTPSEFADVVGRFNDAIVAREAAQDRERRARDRFQSIFDNSVFGMYVSTPDGRFLQVNPALVRMLGYDSEEELMAAGPAALYANPEEREPALSEALRTREPPTLELEWTRRDGTPISVRIGGKLIEDGDGQPAFEMIVQDITEERKTEDQLRQTQKMEAIGQLAGGVAHDFNNLLTVIGGNVELLEDDIPSDDPLRQDLTEISRATRRATALTRRLLTFSRLQQRGGPLEDANVVIPSLVKLLIPLIGENVRIETELRDGPFPLGLDAGELEQIVLNLVLNARDALPYGGTIRIETGAACGPGGQNGLQLTVGDDGVGMDQATSQRIFEPFYTTKPMGQGTGLGLSTVYGVVKRAGGTLAVESELGEGTTMRMWLPIVELPAVAGTPEPEPEAAAGTERILVVEDDVQVLTFVRRALTQAGYEVVTATDGDEALELLQESTPAIDLVLTDVVMPRVGGDQVAEYVGRFRPELPVLFMSGYIDNTFLSTELEHRPELLLRKPFTATELRTRVRGMLDGSIGRGTGPSAD